MPDWTNPVMVKKGLSRRLYSGLCLISGESNTKIPIRRIKAIKIFLFNVRNLNMPTLPAVLGLLGKHRDLLQKVKFIQYLSCSHDNSR